MQKIKLYPEVKFNSYNGNVEEDKVIEVDGKKFVDDGTGKPKVGEDGNPIPFVDKANPNPTLDLSSAELEELAKVNPKVAKVLQDAKEAQDKLDKFNAEMEENKRKEAEKSGDWQKLYESEKAKRELLEKDFQKQLSNVNKYKTSVENVLKDMVATIPEEKKALIPDDFSPRQKLEYITKNAKLLGVKGSLNQNGEPPAPSDANPTGTDEEKIINEIDELRKKPNRTALEDKLLYEKAVKLKELRAKKQS